MADTCGKVWLVGAGPSDAGLFTLRGYELLKTADVVVYDRLVGIGILGLIPPAAQKFDVGKFPNRHPVPQTEINRILVREAKCGNRVVRLKGGDPFLFGRGGEEAEALRSAGIPYEIVPGVSASIAVPEYAGIPVTHRECSSSLHIFTGHSAQRQENAIDFSAASHLKGTLVFLMGVASAEHICSALIKAGMDAGTPAAAVENGTTARQRTVAATLGTLAETMKEQSIRPPAVIVVGPAAALADRLCWTACRPLDGKRIVVTRPRTKMKNFCRKIELLGGEAIPCPCIETVSSPEAILSEAVSSLTAFTWITFSSSAGADCFFRALKQSGKDTRALSGIRIAAVGPATAKYLSRYGIFPDLMPQKFDGIHLGETLAQKAGNRDRILVIRAENGSRSLEGRLKQSGIPYKAIPAYHTQLPLEKPLPEIRHTVENLDFDWLTFTSASSVKGFLRIFPHFSTGRCTAVCIGPSTGMEAESCGFHTIVSDVSTEDGMIQTMLSAVR